MTSYTLTDSSTYFPESNHHHQPPVKTESSASPDLLAHNGTNTPSVPPFQFKLQPSSSSSRGSHPSTRHPSEPPTFPNSQLYRFGSRGSSYNLMSQGSWPPSPPQVPSNVPQANDAINGGRYTLGHSNSMSYNDDYDDVSDSLVELTHGSQYVPGHDNSSTANGNGKNIRRRSSKGALLSPLRGVGGVGPRSPTWPSCQNLSLISVIFVSFSM